MAYTVKIWKSGKALVINVPKLAQEIENLSVGDLIQVEFTLKKKAVKKEIFNSTLEEEKKEEFPPQGTKKGEDHSMGQKPFSSSSQNNKRIFGGK